MILKKFQAVIEKEKREYVEREEARYSEVMERIYNRLALVHERSKRRRSMIDTFRKLEPAEIDDILAQIDREEDVQPLKTEV